MKIVVTYIILFFIISKGIKAQDSTVDINLQNKFIERIDNKAEYVNRQLAKNNEKYSERLKKEELRLIKLLKGKKAHYSDSSIRRLFDVLNFSEIKARGSQRKYMPYLDSLKTSLGYFKSSNSTPNERLGKLSEKLDRSKDAFRFSQDIQNELDNKSKVLVDQFSKVGLLKELKRYNKQVYYYKQQVQEYKKYLERPNNIEQKVLAVMRNSDLFKRFFLKNSDLAKMFGFAGNGNLNNNSIVLEGLQSNEQIKSALLQKYGVTQISQHLPHQVQQGKSEIQKLKDELTKRAEKNDELKMPDFKANSQKTKKFAERIGFGADIQSTKNTSYFPSRSDFALTTDYSLNDRSKIGLGISYKLGWGTDIRHIQMSNQGIGFRSFFDYKIKGSFWLTGGAEMNYLSEFKNLNILKNYLPWQKSALLGISKSYKISSKAKGKIQLLYDFLHNQQTPKAQPVIFRFGYKIK